MKPETDFDKIRELYLLKYKEAVQEGKQKLPTYLLPWEKVLGEIQRLFFNDFHTVGVYIYPYYPVDTLFVDFANPFKKVAVLIKYKHSNILELESKIEYLKVRGWTTYLLESNAVKYTANELFEREGLGDRNDFIYLDREVQQDFFKKYALVNSECFAESIKESLRPNEGFR